MRFLIKSVLALSLALSFAACGKKTTADGTVAQATCDAQLHTRVAEIKAKQIEWYQSRGLDVPSEDKQIQLHVGTNGRSVVVVHGFVSSPFYMTDISSEFAAKGYTVITPLLTGFGSDPKSANASHVEDWKQSVADAVDAAKICANDVSVIGHSLGAAILTDEINSGQITGINHIVLLAPFFKAHSTWPALLSTVLASRVEVIDMNTFRTATGGLDPYVYLPFARPLPGEPEPFLPLPATNEALKLQATFAAPATTKIDVPLLVAVSEADSVIDSAFALDFVKSHFAAPSLLIYEKAKNIEHSFQRRVNNPEFDALMARIFAHLR